MLGLYYLGSRVLHGLGLFDQYLELSVEMQHYDIRNGQGELVRGYSLGQVNQVYGPLQGISRAALIGLLQEACGDVVIHMGTTVSALSQSDTQVEVTFNDGSTASFDLVVAADGLHSDTRKMLWDESEYIYWETGWGGWVVWADAALASKDAYTEYWGAGNFLGLYPTRDRLGVFLGGPVRKVRQLGYRASVEAAKARGGGRSGTIPALLDGIEETSDPFFWDFHDCRTQCWSKGRVVLLGDAAVGFLPTAGIGASMAMEAAAVLNDELSRTNAQFVRRALHLFEKRHRQRAEAAQKSSRQIGRMMFVESAPVAWLRNQLLRFYTLKMFVRSIAGLMEEPI
jgi:FAD-dependent urate hydroxylase